MSVDMSRHIHLLKDMQSDEGMLEGMGMQHTKVRAHHPRRKIAKHEMDVRVAESSSIQLDKNIIGTWFGHRHHFDLESEVGTGVFDDGGFAFFGDVEVGRFRSHYVY